MRLRCPAFLFAAATAAFSASLASASAPVVMTEADETIPTYLSGPPDPDPMFYFGRQSQGAEGRTYPYPLYDNLTNRKGEQTYHLVYLENEYVKVGIMPEIGGKLFSAVDKTNHYDFVYHQHVIKPALIGLIGAWISGGIEWNIPHHHRASTFLPVQWKAESNPDGSKTVWVGELEPRQRMRWAVGYTLRPGSSVLECSVRIVNRTPVANTMLAFANVAVNANPDYQIIFPPATRHVAYHFKREFADWPVAHSQFNGADFTAGVDVSWYKNHQSANSMFAWNYQDDFFAGYDHGREAGTMSVADHHIVPGKKFWTWGNGPRGRMWDGILTDTDGPYVELMVGAYSDNQPDYSWLQPFEERSFAMHWYPFRDIGGVKNANLDAAVNLEVTGGAVRVGFYATRDFPQASVLLKAGDRVLLSRAVAINPGQPFTAQVPLPAGVDEHDLRASLSAEGRELVAYAPARLAPEPAPVAVTRPPAPADMTNEEELVLAGQRIDQFHDPLAQAEPYWQEALRRDPGEVEANTGLGRLDLRNARWAAAEGHFRQALARLTFNYTTPKNAEPYYYLGVALQAQGRNDAAFDAFYKAAWSQEWKSPAYFSLAEIAAGRGDFAAALDFADRSLDANALNVRAYGLKASILRHLGRGAEVPALLAFAAAKTDPLDARLMAEAWLAAPGDATGRPLFALLNQFTDDAQELGAEYADAGLWQDGKTVLAEAAARAADRATVSPIVYYYLGDFAARLGDPAGAAAYRREAAGQSPAYVFPFQAEVIPVLRAAIAANPRDARAPYYLGNLLFDWQPAEAVALWQQSAALDPAFPMTWRNLAQFYSHRDDSASQAQAIACLEKAVALSDDYPEHFAELDQLYQAAGVPVEKRLALLESHQATVAKKDEGLASLIALKTFVGRPDEAIALLEGRTFSIWEGGTRFNTGEAWLDAHLVRGLQRLRARQPGPALEDFREALSPPANLRAEPRGPVRVAEVYYWVGCAYAALGEGREAGAAWETATGVDLTEAPRRGGPVQGNPLSTRGTQRFYQALAREKLASSPDNAQAFRELITSAHAALVAGGPGATAPIPPQSDRVRVATAHYLAGLGHAGLGEKDEARREFDAALATVPDYLGAEIARSQL
jgi:tetratricopeptide (TPR) repeat protein